MTTCSHCEIEVDERLENLWSILEPDGRIAMVCDTCKSRVKWEWGGGRAV